MNDQTQQLIEKLNNGVDLASAELPVIAEQVLRWAVFSHIAGAVLGVLLLIGSARGVWYVSVKKPKWSRDNFMSIESINPGGAMAIVLSMTTGIASFVVVIANTFQAAQAIIAPRVYLIEYLRGMM